MIDETGHVTTLRCELLSHKWKPVKDLAQDKCVRCGLKRNFGRKYEKLSIKRRTRIWKKARNRVYKS